MFSGLIPDQRLNEAVDLALVPVFVLDYAHGLRADARQEWVNVRSRDSSALGDLRGGLGTFSSQESADSPGLGFAALLSGRATAGALCLGRRCGGG
jgi:hypothetical protein